MAGYRLPLQVVHPITHALLPVYVWVLARDKAQAADLAEAQQMLGADFPN